MMTYCLMMIYFWRFSVLPPMLTFKLSNPFSPQRVIQNHWFMITCQLFLYFNRSLLNSPIIVDDTEGPTVWPGIQTTHHYWFWPSTRTALPSEDFFDGIWLAKDSLLSWTVNTPGQPKNLTSRSWFTRPRSVSLPLIRSTKCQRG